jgi:hypothetical protein
MRPQLIRVPIPRREARVSLNLSPRALRLKSLNEEELEHSRSRTAGPGAEGELLESIGELDRVLFMDCLWIWRNVR